MKIIKSIFIAGFVFFFFTGILFAQEKAQKFASVDLSRLFDEYQKTKDYDKKLEAEQKIKPLQNEESVGYKDKDLVSSLTRLGISLKDTETLLPVIPKNLPLPEAIKFALRKHMKSYTNAQRES